MTPLVHEIMPVPALDDMLPLFADWPGLVVFDSAKTSPQLGRFSYLSADPFRTFELAQARFGVDPFAEIRAALASYQTETVPELPPFQGGAAGVLSYELGRCFEKLPEVPHDELEIPHLAVGLYDWVIAWDHQQGQCWLISQGFPETDLERRRRRARERISHVCATVVRTYPPFLRTCNAFGSPLRKGVPSYNSLYLPPEVPQGHQERQLEIESPVELFAPCLPAPGPAGLLSNFSRESYLKAVERVIEYIRAGDIFQANLAQRLMYPSDEPPLALYQRLRQRNPAPFAGCFFRDDWAILSASPERFIQLDSDGLAETRPIKGTRPRRNHPEIDLFTADELRESDKDIAENLMIVDLLRNDLSRVCRPGSIRVPQLCEVENYETVQHLVSVVQGELKPGQDAWDLLRATFPGGSITGAPKVRAMEIITELEQVTRGPYCGSLFYVGFDGRCDSSILIRTFVVRRGWVQCSVGGGITVQSDPDAEYHETLHKAAGMLRIWEEPQ
jgi:para-aminobenzoate synthetase component I